METMENHPQTAIGQAQTAAPAIGAEQLKQFTKYLREYHAGLSRTKHRVISSENWWKMRNTEEEQEQTQIGKDGGFTSKSGWLHNVIVSKHADAMESYPEPNILPREEGDREEAKRLTSIVPCVLEQNHFEEIYSSAMWAKIKSGTGVYKVVWDKDKLGGLGDIAIEQISVLNLYWEPGIQDIQKSRYFFHTELVEKDLLRQRYPALNGKLKGSTFLSARFLYDDSVSTSNKATVIDVYYHTYSGGKPTLQYCKYVEDTVLYATENEPDMAQRGLYDHGRYPFVFDALYPMEGSPCGYGYVDICRSPQTEIDLMKTAFTKNAMAGATPRFLVRQDGKINEEELLDLSKPLVHVSGNLDEAAIRSIGNTPLAGNYVQMLNMSIQELRETSGNTETSTGNAASGVTAASAIAALQEASGKGSRDSTQASYRAYGRIVELCIELIRQFYDIPRQFRILGQYGVDAYVSYDNAGIRMQHQGVDFDRDMGYRVPLFDVKVSAQKRNTYTKISQNELATQFFQMGFFNPQMTDQALMCLDMMDFDGKDQIMQKVAQNGTMAQKLAQYMQMALSFADASGANSQLKMAIQQDMASTLGPSAVPAMPVAAQSSRVGQEPSRVSSARAQAQEASQPDGGRVIGKKER